MLQPGKADLTPRSPGDKLEALPPPIELMGTSLTVPKGRVSTWNEQNGLGGRTP